MNGTKQFSIFDSNIYLGALSSTASTWPNVERTEIERAFAESCRVLTCQPQKTEFEKNIGNHNLSPVSAKHPDVVIELRDKLAKAEDINLLEDEIRPLLMKYGKDAFVPAMIHKVGAKSCQLYSRDVALMNRIREDFPDVEVNDLTPAKKAMRELHSGTHQ